MDTAPATFFAQREAWSFFCTLTFAGKVPTSGLAFALQKRWLDRVSPNLLHVPATALNWLSREELGEANGRLHLHCLLGEIPDAARVNQRTCLALMSEWEKVTLKRLGSAGMARVRVFAPNLRGAEYVLKGLESSPDWSARAANCYELVKFDSGESGRTVRLARCLAVRWLGRKGNKYSLQAQAMARGRVCEM